MSCCLQDEVIHKKVFRIVGSIPAVNFLKVPKDKALGLSGRFLYLQVKASNPMDGSEAADVCAIHHSIS